MSNTWWYTSLISSRDSIAAQEIEAITAANGYSLRNPVTKRIHLERVDAETIGQESLDLETLDSLTPQLSKRGTLLQIWKGEVDISLTFDLTGAGYAWDIKTNKLVDHAFYGSVSICIDNTFLHSDSPERFEVSRDGRQLFISLASALAAPYGYSADEYATEQFIHRWHIHDDTRLQRKPAVLFWENYFSTAYFNAIGSSTFEKLGAKIEEFRSGYLVSLFDYPWDVQLPTLESINRAWK